MRPDQRPAEPPVVYATGTAVPPSPGAPAGAIAGSGAAPPAGRLELPLLAPLELAGRLPRLSVRPGPRAARAAVGGLVLATFAIVATAAAGPSVLVPRSSAIFPTWEAGPLHGLLPRLIEDPQTLGLVFSAVLGLMLVAYGIVLRSVRSLSMRTIVVTVVALHAILLLSPPLQLTDLFNYIGYGHLGGLHHLDPYTHVIKQEFFDPVYRFTSWHNLASPYGELFTALTYPLSFFSLPVAYWTVKVATVLLSLGFVALVWQCARRLGRDPRFAVAFVALNPIVLIYAVAGFHNDFFMLVPSMGAIALLLGRRDRSAGAAVMIAVAVKFTAIVLLPFLLIAAPTRQRRIAVLLGGALAAIPLIAMSLALYGLSIPNLSDQSALLTDFSFPNLVGLAIGIGGGTPGLLKLATVAVVVVVAHQVHRRRDWLSAAGWSTFALIASLAWLVPWYVIWLLPLAALGTSVRLRRVALALTVFLVLAFMPATPQFLNLLRINPLSSSVGQASVAHQYRLSH